MFSMFTSYGGTAPLNIGGDPGRRGWLAVGAAASMHSLSRPEDPVTQASTNGTVGIRIFLRDDASTDPSDIESLRITRRT